MSRTEGRPTCEDPRRSLREAFDAVVQREIPWGLVFGTHDTEYGITREELMQEVLKQPFNRTEAGIEHIDGRGLYYGGARVIRLSEGKRRFESWLRLADGSVIKQQPEHLPEQR